MKVQGYVQPMPKEDTPPLRDSAIYIRATAEEKATIEANADRRGVSVSEHLRESAIKSK